MKPTGEEKILTTDKAGEHGWAKQELRHELHEFARMFRHNDMVDTALTLPCFSCEFVSLIFPLRVLRGRILFVFSWKFVKFVYCLSFFEIRVGKTKNKK